MKLSVLHHDDVLLAVDKPSGLLVHRGWGDDPVVALTLARDVAGKHVHPVHRLDRGTSGVLLFALDKATAADVSRAFEVGAVQKRYVALVRGVPRKTWDVDSPVPREEKGERVPARTRFARLAVGAPYALVEARPETGRLHQIRRHLHHVSHPVLGDSNYGDGRHNRFARAHLGLTRLALHASSLELEHPSTGARLRIVAPLAPELVSVLERLRIDPRDAVDSSQQSAVGFES